ncbi:unnamed protein product, partial [marine sediment metagenome]
LESEPTLLYWLSLCSKTANAAGTLKVRDGTDATGKEKLRVTALLFYHLVFNPPIRCAMGLFVEIDTEIADYTVGYLTEEVAEK